MNQIAAPFGDTLRRSIREARKSRTEVAAKVGISTSYLEKIMSGDREPSKPVRTLLAQEFPALESP